MTTGDSLTDPESLGPPRSSGFGRVPAGQDPAIVRECVAKNCVIENTHPAPDGGRHAGRAAGLGHRSGIATNPGLALATEFSRAATATGSAGGAAVGRDGTDRCAE